MASPPRHRVVIVGGGFGGLFAARALRRSAEAGAVLPWAVTFARESRRERTFTTRQIGSLHDLYATPVGADPRTAVS
jgi:2-polyprenyl-6-methoxyphenol hydroxylase-like FAD-dependent oxidoreductase